MQIVVESLAKTFRVARALDRRDDMSVPRSRGAPSD